jgi:nucleoside-diphosphate-sugar epimerase
MPAGPPAAKRGSRWTFSIRYGINETLPKREDLPALPISPYAVAKLAGEGYCRSFTAVYGLETVALRYSTSSVRGKTHSLSTPP